MNIEELERKLNQGERLGLKKDIDDPSYLGWILLTKRKPPIVYPREAYGENGEGIYRDLVELHEKLTKTPYHILNLELKREVHEGEAYETEEDYRFKESLYFETLQQVEYYISNLGYCLNNIKYRREIDAP